MFFIVVKIVGFILKLNNSVFRIFSFCKASYEALENNANNDNKHFSYVKEKAGMQFVISTDSRKGEIAH